MTRMLYIGGMNTKPNNPEEIMFGPSYSLRANLKANSWAFVAMLLSWGGDVLLPIHKDWPVALRAIIALAPIVPALLWARSFLRWVRGMDEMHRRLTQEACLFATVVTLFVVTARDLLDKAGVFQASLQSASFPISLVLAFYFVGYTRINRRYK